MFLFSSIAWYPDTILQHQSGHNLRAKCGYPALQCTTTAIITSDFSDTMLHGPCTLLRDLTSHLIETCNLRLITPRAPMVSANARLVKATAYKSLDHIAHVRSLTDASLLGHEHSGRQATAAYRSVTRRWISSSAEVVHA